jgi:hypothetical protein
LDESELGKIPDKHNVLKVLALALALIVPLLLTFWVDYRYREKRQRRRNAVHRRRHNRSGNTEI